MTLLTYDRKNELIRLVSENIEAEYNELYKINGFPKDHPWINMVWIRFVKDCEVKIDKNGFTIETSVTPIYKYIPNPRSGIKDVKFPSKIFDSKNVKSSLRDLDLDTKQRILFHLPKLIVTSLESNRMEIPSKTEITQNINNNIEGFLNFVEHNGKKVRSIAPISGLEFNDDVTNDDVHFTKPTFQDIKNIEMIKMNKKDYFDFDMFYDLSSPILIVEHEFDWNPNPNDYSVAKNCERLHATSKSKFETLINVCRSIVEHPERVGIGIIFHMDPNWTTYSSTRLITEDPSPNFRPLQIDGRPMKRDESYYPGEQLLKGELQGLLSKIIIVRGLVLKQPVDNPYMDLLYAVNLYGKSGEESDSDWILLNLVKCLESLGNLHNGLNNDSTRCESAKKIIRALKISDSLEIAVIKEAYKVRSMRAAHAPKDIPIDAVLIENLRKLDRRLILDFLKTVN
jgi:hypothetical protein